jgi:hypothetical protein
MIADGPSPPGPKMRRPGISPGQREMSIFEPTIDSYASGSQTSSDLLRLAHAALSAEELAEFLISRRYLTPISPTDGIPSRNREATCH